MKKIRSKALALVLAVLAAVSLPGCGGGPSGSSGSTSAQTSANTAQTGGSGETISIMIPLWSPEPPQAGAPVWKKMNEMTGYNLDLQFVPADSYDDKLNISIAANQLPHAFCVLRNKESAFVNAARSGMFWDIGDALAASTDLSKNLSKEVLYNASIDGVNYFLPRTRVTTRTAVNIRKDWLEAVGMEVPETMDELYDVLVAFATKDPDGNGKNDTFGMITAAEESTGVWGFNIMAVINGSGNFWVEQDGELIPTFTTQPYIDTIKWYKKLYDEKLINQDFATIQQEKGFELLNAEQGGVFLGNSDEILNRFDALLAAKQAENPDTDLTDLFVFQSKIKSSDGNIHIPAEIGFYGGIAFPKTTLRTEEDFRKVFGIFDTIESEEGKTLIKWGMKDVNYKIEDGQAVQINNDLYTRDVGSFDQLTITGRSIPPKLTGQQSPMRMSVEADQIENQKYGLMGPTGPFISATNAEKGNEIRKIYTDATIQWIVGEIDESGYMAAIEQWKASGGRNIIDEMNAAYKASKAG